MSRDLYSQVSVLFIRHSHSCGAATALVGDGEDVVERRVDLNSSLGTQSIRSRKQNEEGLIHNSNSSPFSLKAAEFLCLPACSMPASGLHLQPLPSSEEFPSQPKRMNLFLLSLGHYNNTARFTPLCSRGKKNPQLTSIIYWNTAFCYGICVCVPSQQLPQFLLPEPHSLK